MKSSKSSSPRRLLCYTEEERLKASGCAGNLKFPSNLSFPICAAAARWTVFLSSGEGRLFLCCWFRNGTTVLFSCQATRARHETDRKEFLTAQNYLSPSPLRTSCASFVIISGGQGRMPGELDGAQKRAGSKRIAVRFRKFLLWNAKWRRLEFEAGDTRCKIQARILSDHRRSILPREKLAAHRPNKERGDNGGGKTKKVAGSRCPRAWRNQSQIEPMRWDYALKIPRLTFHIVHPDPLFLDLDEESVFYIRIVLSERNFQWYFISGMHVGNLRGNRFFPLDLTVVHESIYDGAHIMKNIYTRIIYTYIYRVDRALKIIFRGTRHDCRDHIRRNGNKLRNVTKY